MQTDLKKKLENIGKKYYSFSKNNRGEELLTRTLNINEEMIQSGAGRGVVDGQIISEDLNEYVVKFAHQGRNEYYGGLVQNKREAKVWNESNEEEREFLAEVLSCSDEGYWLVMKKGEVLTDTREGYYSWMLTVRELFDGKLLLEDINRTSVVIIDSEFKICDYGEVPK